MKYSLLLMTFIILITINLNAQSKLNFEKRFVESEDKWVAFQKNKDNAYAFGFIYIDSEAGLTLNFEGTFEISSDGKFIRMEQDSLFNMKMRLQPNNVLVAFIPESKFSELKIDTIPEWLKYYKKDENSIERLYRWGYLYNSWRECEKALTFLEKANKINPKFKGLAVELAYSYNCTNRFDNAASILEEELRTNNSDAYVSKEYIYTFSKNGKIDKAIKQYKTAKKTIKDKTYDVENCFNIMQYFYVQGDKKNFNIWYKELFKMDIKNEMIKEYANRMKEHINSQK